jgi:tetratricopeptide (TPR) repeat protein
MSWRSVPFTVIMTLFILIVSPVLAQDIDNAAQCKNKRETLPPDSVITACTALLKSRSTVYSQSEIHYNRARAYYSKSNLSLAIADLDQSIKLDQNASYAYALRGECFYREHNRDRAKADLDLAIQLDPNDSNAFAARGALLAEERNYAAALADDDKALELDEEFAAVYFNRGNVYMILDEPFLADAESAIEYGLKSASAYVLRGEGYWSNHDLKRAFSDANYALQVDPRNPHAYYLRGVSYFSTGDIARAFTDINYAISLKPDEPVFYEGRGNTYYTNHDYDRAIADYDKAIQLNPDYISAYLARSRAYQQKGVISLAVANFDIFINKQLNPSLTVSFPGVPGQSDSNAVQFASIPIPDLGILKQCKDQATDKDAFYSCFNDRALPSGYRLSSRCLDEHRDDVTAAVVCSTGNTNVAKAYDKFKGVKACFDDPTNDNDGLIAECLGHNELNNDEKYYIDCLRNNPNSYAGMAVCALGRKLTPEQQIALSCVPESGGVAYAYAACVGGQLTARELGKCWDHGIAVQGGCFGSNNEIQKFWNGLDGRIRDAFGANGEGYKLFHELNNDVLSPGANNEFVKFVNNGLSDVKNGPGPNNEFVKAGKAISDGVKSIGKIFGL